MLPVAREIVEQDKEIVETMKPSFTKMAPSIVTLLDGDKTVAMGTVVRENGFILTKYSEIVKAKALKADYLDQIRNTGKVIFVIRFGGEAFDVDGNGRVWFLLFVAAVASQ